MKFEWGSRQQESFEQLKQLLASAETLAYFDINVPTQVIADASPVGLGAVMVQEQNSESCVILRCWKTIFANGERSAWIGLGM